MENKLVKCGKLRISNNNPFTLIAGPCQLENEKHALDVASELKNHPWFVGVQFHPEFRSRPFTPHPLFSSFIKAAEVKKGRY